MEVDIQLPLQAGSQVDPAFLAANDPANDAVATLANELRDRLQTSSKGAPCYSDADATAIADNFKNALLAILSKNRLLKVQADFIVNQPKAAVELLIGKMEVSDKGIKPTGLTQIMHEVGKTYSAEFFSGSCACSSQSSVAAPKPLFQLNPKKLTEKANAAREKRIFNFISQALIGVEYTHKELHLANKTLRALESDNIQRPSQDDNEPALRKVSMALAARHSGYGSEADGLSQPESYSTLTLEDEFRLYEFLVKHIMPGVFAELLPWQIDVISILPVNWAAIIGGNKTSDAMKKGWLGGESSMANFGFTQLLNFSFKNLMVARTEGLVVDNNTSHYSIKDEDALLPHKQDLINEIVARTYPACVMLKNLYVEEMKKFDPQFDAAYWFNRAKADAPQQTM